MIFLFITDNSKEAMLKLKTKTKANPNLQQMLYIEYLTQLNQYKLQVFIDSGSKEKGIQASFTKDSVFMGEKQIQ